MSVLEASSIVQAVSTVVLVVVTTVYVVFTRKMAKGTEHMVQLTRESGMNAQLPVVVVRLIDRPRPYTPFSTFEHFDLELVNVGLGPAIDTSFVWSDESLGFRCVECPAVPLTLAAGQSVKATFQINARTPFPASDAIRWPRNQLEADLEQHVNQLRPGLTAEEVAEIVTVAERDELDRAHQEFMNEVRRQVAKLNDAGTLILCYRDSYNRPLTSSSRLLFGNKQQTSERLPKDVVFRNLELHSLPLEIPAGAPQA